MWAETTDTPTELRFQYFWVSRLEKRNYNVDWQEKNKKQEKHINNLKRSKRQIVCHAKVVRQSSRASSTRVSLLAQLTTPLLSG